MGTLERNGSGGGGTLRSPAHKEQAYGQNRCTPGAVVVRELLPAHLYKDETDGGQPIVTALFQEPTESGGVGYAIREYSLVKGDMFYRFPKSGRHSGRAVIRQEWYRETKMRLPDWVFEAADSAS